MSGAASSGWPGGPRGLHLGGVILTTVGAPGCWAVRSYGAETVLAGLGGCGWSGVLRWWLDRRLEEGASLGLCRPNPENKAAMNTVHISFPLGLANISFCFSIIEARKAKKAGSCGE